MNMNKRTLLIGLVVLVLAVSAIKAIGGGSSSGYSGSYSTPSGEVDGGYVEQSQGGYVEQTPDGYIEQTQGGYIGGNGTDSYYFDPNSGCTVIPGEGVSC
jgi:hypothetical protein